MRSIALLGVAVVRTATATRFLRGLAEHSPANVTTTANYTRCVFQELRHEVACHPENEKKRNLYEKVRSMDEAFALCDADPKCDAVQRTPHRKGNNNGMEWEDEETEEEEEAEREEWEEAERRSLFPVGDYNRRKKKKKREVSLSVPSVKTPAAGLSSTRVLQRGIGCSRASPTTKGPRCGLGACTPSASS